MNFSLLFLIASPDDPSPSVLEKFPRGVGREVVLDTVKHVAHSLSLSSQSAPCFLREEKDVIWTLEVTCYGLTLPLTDHDALRDCVNIYCEYLSAFLPIPKASVPQPIMEDPNLYGRIMVKHLYHLFVPRTGDSTDLTHKQAVLCHRVLRTLQSIAQSSRILSRDTWESLLLLLLSVNDTLLASPTVKDDIGDLMCERVLSVLFEIWLVACSKCYPSPSTWKTFCEVTLRWRHRIPLVQQWNRVCAALTSRMMKDVFVPGSSAAERSNEEEKTLISSSMSSDAVSQTWYRMIHLLCDPVDFARVEAVSSTPHFMQWAILQDSVVEPCQHPCLSELPFIFHTAMKGISTVVDTLLGFPSPCLNPLRPKVNSILHCFGSWLFDAAVIGALPLTSFGDASDKIQRHDSVTRRPSSVLAEHTVTGSELTEVPASLRSDRFELGRAEALGTLCRIFTSKTSEEEILPVYLARFYLVLHLALKTRNELTESIAAVIRNGQTLLLCDLDGSQVLLPDLLYATEAVLYPHSEELSGSYSLAELRSSAISLLCSFVSLPHQLLHLPIKDIACRSPQSSYALPILKPRIVNVLFTALETVTSPKNIEMLLAALLLCIQDFAEHESSTHPELHSDGMSDTSGVILSGPSSHHSSELGSLKEDEVMESPYTSFGSEFSTGQPSRTDTAAAVFARATNFVCPRLKSMWKTDLQISLAALEFLGGLAQVQQLDQSLLECKRVVKRLCEYITEQCNRPPPSHTRDLHSSIVAAYRCLSLWLLHSSALLREDKESLNLILEVIELGICGARSEVKNHDPIPKTDKALRPVSLRVKDTAEHLLHLIFTQIGSDSFGTSRVQELDEEVILSRAGVERTSKDLPTDHFIYYSLESGIILALLIDQAEVLNEGSAARSTPSSIAIIRGPFGRYTWGLHYRPFPYASTYTTPVNPGRPIPMSEILPLNVGTAKFFPDSAERIPLCNADQSVPALESLLTSDPKTHSELNKLEPLLDRQAALETRLSNVTKSQHRREYPNPETDARPPILVKEFNPVRLFMAHFGPLSQSLVSTSEPGEESPPHLLPLDSVSPEFPGDLLLLDALGNKTCDTVHVFYSDTPDSTLTQMLANVQDITRLPEGFSSFLGTLGWPLRSGETDNNAKDSSDEDRVVYWANEVSEISFVVPSTATRGRSSWTGQHGPVAIRVVIVWLEHDEDFNSLPVKDMLQWNDSEAKAEGKSSYCVIGIHTLQSGLYRIHLRGSHGGSTFFNFSLPLVDGMLLSRRTLGPLVRQAVLNYCHRVRLEKDSSYHPHVKRKLKIQEMVQKYQQRVPAPEALFQLCTRASRQSRSANFC
ncbi:unnamed protein product [Cyprideis torosa]|uniref:Uncharacterized protein n=1 Tax=Cyprideis torosa TaxID=163714 RepID=A0A7R8WKJ9_9CRUS|nr:unnamed protein product [Cyprideis torosa]CAG0896200.1 unnamed protein product [Cyprideis torosa]